MSNTASPLTVGRDSEASTSRVESKRPIAESGAGNGGNGGGVDVTNGLVLIDDVFAEVNGMLPFTLDEGAALKYTAPPSESVMDKDIVSARIDEIMTRWKVTDNRVKTLLLNAILLYLVENGSSPRGVYSTYLTVQGSKYHIGVVKDVIDKDMRRFARAFANYTRALMCTHDCRKFAADHAARYGMRRYPELAFDFADACTGLNADMMLEIAKVKSRLLAGKSYESLPDVASGLSAAGAEDGGSSRGPRSHANHSL